jgi:hypothetical protein
MVDTRGMSRFRLIASGVDVSGVNAELEAHPELWDANTDRTADPSSPHHGIPDIWIRWCDPKFQYYVTGFTDWPAWHALPSLHSIVRNLSGRETG